MLAKALSQVFGLVLGKFHLGIIVTLSQSMRCPEGTGLGETEKQVLPYAAENPIQDHSQGPFKQRDQPRGARCQSELVAVIKPLTNGEFDKPARLA
jgi:hypothetical protein